MPLAQAPSIENRTYDEMTIGETASLTRIVTQRDIDLFATVSGDVNPAHVDPDYAATDLFHHVIVHGMWGAGLISAVLGTRLPGPGCLYLGQDLHFRRPVAIGDTITACVTLREKKPEKQDVVFDCLCTNQTGEAVITGTAFIRAPREKVRRAAVAMPEVRVERHPVLEAALARAAALPAIEDAAALPAAAPLLHVLDVPGHPRPLILASSPETLEQAQQLARAIGIAAPRTAILAPPLTFDAALASGAEILLLPDGASADLLRRALCSLGGAEAGSLRLSGGAAQAEADCAASPRGAEFSEALARLLADAQSL